MTSTNGNGKPGGTPVTLDEARERYRLARAKSRTIKAEAEARLLESSLPYATGYDYGGLVDPLDQFRDPATGEIWRPLGRTGRRDRGAVFDSEQDSQAAREIARVLADTNEYAIGALEQLTTFTVADGCTYRAVSASRKAPASKLLLNAVQDVMDQFSEANLWPEWEQELFLRSRRDGEYFLRYFPQGDGTLQVRTIEPEHIAAPDHDPDQCYESGIHTDPDDEQRVLGYWLRYEPQDQGEEIDACEIEHVKVNIDRVIRRGLSDFYATKDSLDGVKKLVRNMREGGSVQAAIAWIEQFEAGTGSVSSHITSARDQGRTYSRDPVTGRDINYQRFDPGTIVKVGRGRTYQAAPLAQNTTQHISIVQACLRSIGTRWCMPEYMISGDASNANYSSTLVSGSPFVRAVKRWQSFYKRRFLRVIWRAVHAAACCNRLAGYTWEQVKRLVDIQCEAPTPEIANESELASVRQTELQAGVLSRQTWRQKAGYDDEQERANLAQEPIAQGGVPVMPGQSPEVPDTTTEPGDDQAAAVATNDLRATVGGSQAVAALQSAFYSGQLPRAAAVANAVLVFGFTSAEAEQLFPDVAPVKLTPDEGQGQVGPQEPSALAGMGPALESRYAWLREHYGGSLAAAISRAAVELLEAQGPKREEGEVWQGQSGRWFTISNGRCVPAKGPGGEVDEEAVASIDKESRKIERIRDREDQKIDMIRHREDQRISDKREVEHRKLVFYPQLKDEERLDREYQKTEMTPDEYRQKSEAIYQKWQEVNRPLEARYAKEDEERTAGRKLEDEARTVRRRAEDRARFISMAGELPSTTEGRESAWLEAQGPKREEGEVWQGQSGRWFTIKNGRAVPAKAPSSDSEKGNRKKPSREELDKADADYKEAQRELQDASKARRQAEDNLASLQKKYDASSSGIEKQGLTQKIADAHSELKAAEGEYQRKHGNTEFAGSTLRGLHDTASGKKAKDPGVVKAEADVEKAKVKVERAKMLLEKRQDGLVVAKKALTDAKATAKAQSPAAQRAAARAAAKEAKGSSQPEAKPAAVAADPAAPAPKSVPASFKPEPGNQHYEKVRDGLVDSLDHLTLFKEYQQHKTIAVPDLWREAKKRQPDLTLDQFHQSLQAMNAEKGGLELHIRNEVRNVPADEQALAPKDKSGGLLYYIQFGQGVTPSALKREKIPSTAVDKPESSSAIVDKGVGGSAPATKGAAAMDTGKMVGGVHVKTADVVKREKDPAFARVDDLVQRKVLPGSAGLSNVRVRQQSGELVGKSPKTGKDVKFHVEHVRDTSGENSKFGFDPDRTSQHYVLVTARGEEFPGGELVMARPAKDLAHAQELYLQQLEGMKKQMGVQ